MTVFSFRVFIGVSMLQVAFLVFNFLTHITNEFFVYCNVLDSIYTRMLPKFFYRNGCEILSVCGSVPLYSGIFKFVLV